MFRRGSKVVYPRYGAGKIKKKYKVEMNGKKKQYYKLTFYNSPVDISVPVKKAEKMGLRKPSSKYRLRKELKKLGRTVKITDDLMKNLDTITGEKLLSGEIAEAVKLVNILKSLAKKKEVENKNFSYTASEKLDMAEDFIKSEIELVLGKKAIGRYDLSND